MQLVCDYGTGRCSQAVWKEGLVSELQYQTVDKPKGGALPQGYNQGQQQSEKDTLLEDNCSWEGLETRRCSSALR